VWAKAGFQLEFTPVKPGAGGNPGIMTILIEAAIYKQTLNGCIEGEREMRRLTWLLLLLAVPWVISGCGKGKEIGTQERMKHEAKKIEGEKKTEEMEIEGLTMESIRKEGKMVELTPALAQITPRMQQLFGVTIGKVEVRSIERVIRTVG
jgi:hypothetical protein